MACEQAPKWGRGRRQKLSWERGLARLADFSVCPIPHLGACSRARAPGSSANFDFFPVPNICPWVSKDYQFADNNGPFNVAANGHMVQTPPCWRASYTRGHPKQQKFKFDWMKSLCFRCPRACYSAWWILCHVTISCKGSIILILISNLDFLYQVVGVSLSSTLRENHTYLLN